MRVEYDNVETEDDLRMTYQGEPFTGEVVERPPQGQDIAITMYFNGMEDGPARSSTRAANAGPRAARDAARLSAFIMSGSGIVMATSPPALSSANRANCSAAISWAEDGAPIESFVAEVERDRLVPYGIGW
ncbi:hypothetical protein [Micromonospora sp. NPDC005174]|uniref:hypothetical protein n=1 Tax=Micromonospora sp. NPDC005174 TaxID=3157018 RepID=UPI0033ABE512